MIYKYIYPFCNKSFIGKTERPLWEREDKHAYYNIRKFKQSAIYQHLPSCKYYNHIIDLFRLQNETFILKKFNIHQIRDNRAIVDRADNWYVLLFKETYIIDAHRSSLTFGLKTSKELQQLRINTF